MYPNAPPRARLPLLVIILALALVIILVLGALPPLHAKTLNGFDLSNTLIPADQIVQGGPPKDGIPAILNPQFITPDAMQMKQRQQRRFVLGMVKGAETKAYPIAILNYHELVNDRLDGEPVLISYCPLCGTGMAFSREVGGKTLTFGVSGLLYDNNLLMYDHETLSLWSQATGQAVSGVYKGTNLRWKAVQHMPLRQWLQKYPQTRVLSENTGHYRDYGRNPYQGYELTGSLMFPLSRTDDRYPKKEWVLGIRVKQVTKAYPYSELARAGQPLRERLAGVELEIHYDAENGYAVVKNENLESVAVSYSYWFAWVAFFPDTQVFVAQ